MLKKLLIACMVFSLFGCANTSETTKDSKNTSSVNACDPTEECDETDSTETVEFQEITVDEALSYFTEGKTGILFFGYDNCPYCKEARPILKEVADSLNQEVYYVKVRDDDHNLLYSDDQRQTMTQYIGTWMSENKDEDNKLWLYVPLVVNVQDGVAVDAHESTVDGHDPSEKKMTKKQKKELKEIYTNLLSE